MKRERESERAMSRINFIDFDGEKGKLDGFASMLKRNSSNPFQKQLPDFLTHSLSNPIMYSFQFQYHTDLYL
jgi:hypothetical protein